MPSSAKSSRTPSSVADVKRKAATSAKPQKAADLLNLYAKYFVAPTTTPGTFKVLDLSDNATISYSSHT